MKNFIIHPSSLILPTLLMKGVKHPFHRKKTRLPGWARRVKGSDGADLVEEQRMRVLKLKRVGDVVLPEESEQTDVTAVGEVKQHVKWKHKEALP